MNLAFGPALSPQRRKGLMALFERLEIAWDMDVDFTVAIEKDERIIATGSRKGQFLQCLCVDPAAGDVALLAPVLTELAREAGREGRDHLLLYSPAENVPGFTRLGYHLLAATREVALLENLANGVGRFVAPFGKLRADGAVAAVVIDGDPFTNRDRSLVETAADNCGLLHVFVSARESARFSDADRLRMARACTADLANVVVRPGGVYLHSPSAYPSYCIRDRSRVPMVNRELALTLFIERFAKPLGIALYFIDPEAAGFEARTDHRDVFDLFPKHGIAAALPPGADIALPTAARVRDKLAAGGLDAVATFVPSAALAIMAEALAAR